MQCGSWSYQYEYVNLIVDQREVFLGDFYDNQEWLLENATLHNGTVEYLYHESFSSVYMILILRRQSFYYVFNFVFPTTLVSLVAVIGFHAPINATGRRESKFRLGIMTLLSMSVMLLMLVDEMKFALESIPGQRGSFSDVPLLGLVSFFIRFNSYAMQKAHIDEEVVCVCVCVCVSVCLCVRLYQFFISRPAKAIRLKLWGHNLYARTSLHPRNGRSYPCGIHVRARQNSSRVI
ncbi:unnamed protein product [Gongylonema pulchrum]|uniref:Neur_chan_memb domain-containing protein n=1 Tax=Gongylonema pulchrum TaxID=637853 RepID=A0A3P6PMW3_9BILA|nr:unnamed protein product [Gongylonema pulchrum]